MGNSEGGGGPEKPGSPIDFAAAQAAKAQRERAAERPLGFDRVGRPNAVKPKEDVVKNVEGLSKAMEIVRLAEESWRMNPRGIMPPEIERLTENIAKMHQDTDLEALRVEVVRLYSLGLDDLSSLDGEGLKYRLAVAQAYLKLK